jgi:hypothetical protein
LLLYGGPSNRESNTLPLMAHALEPGDEIRCPHCHRWHPVIRRQQTGTDYTVRMLY